MTPTHPHRRLALRITLACGLGLLANSIHAAVPGSAETIKGLKEALSRGAAAAVDGLGQPGGFLANERVRIPLPEKVQRAEEEKAIRKDPVATGSAIIKKVFGSLLN